MILSVAQFNIVNQNICKLFANMPQFKTEKDWPVWKFKSLMLLKLQSSGSMLREQQTIYEWDTTQKKIKHSTQFYSALAKEKFQ